ncbi:hypothetical protein ACNKU7_17500 [Microbulbifer sp. SA54]|uniref:hypothetical protein n=1 Tax=Microbulbifer sp. SA54 TaxID=3401577 RepID=UPI003AAECB65
MLSVVFFLLFFSHLALFVWTLRLRRAGLPVLILRCLLLALAFDNLVIALGPFLMPSGLYVSLSMLRFWVHAILLPLLLVFVAGVVQGFSNRLRPWLFGIAWALAGLAIAYGYLFDLAPLKLVPADYYPRLVAADGQPPFATIAVNLCVVLAGVWVWRCGRWPWLFLGALQIFVINGAAAGREWGFIFGNIAELVFVVSLLATLIRVLALQDGRSDLGDAGRGLAGKL